MRIDDGIIKGLPEDLKTELLTIAQWLPEKAPLSYAHSKALVLAWRELSQTALEWSGASLVVRINPEPYLMDRERFQAPGIQTLDHNTGLTNYDAEIWAPYEAPWQAVMTHANLCELAGYLKLQVATWGKTQVARRRHLHKDRLDGLSIGIHIQPEDSTADIYLFGDRSLPSIISKDLGDQK
ncbi:hypothetical protein AB4090_09915 [Acidithiobacillus sp. IBUN Pt1247-S3]|uniref:hypothetical protein n=1 Tax=Acidithiobacillus sp. IBUN Pt1247-S3 TaxID=3166642 RepID=UPI0034E3F6D7